MKPDLAYPTGSSIRLRDPIRTAVLTGLFLLVAACGSSDEPGSEAAKAGEGPTLLATGGEERVVNVYNWADYIEPAMLEKFSAETGIKVNYDTYDSNEVLETKLLAGGTGYDVVVPSNTYLERQIKAGALGKIDRSKLPNWKNLDSVITSRVATNDPGN